MRIQRKAAIVVYMLAFISLLTAQDTGPSALQAGPSAPEDTEIRLPTKLLEVPELRTDVVKAVLPESSALETPHMEIPLPQESDLQIAESAFNLPAPGSPAGGRVTGNTESSFFSDGVLGAGSMNHILGALSLYKLGSNPRFRFNFSHEGLDGYNFEKPGAGYFNTEDVISGWVAGDGDVLDAETEATFREEQNGLQGSNDYYAVDNRYLTGTGSLIYTPTDLLFFKAAVDAASTGKILSVKQNIEPPREAEVYARPALTAGFNLKKFTLRLRTGYNFRYVSESGITDNQSLEARLGMETSIRDSIFLSGGIGGYWAFDNEAEIPFDLGVTLNAADLLSFQAEGGFRVRKLSFTGLWQDVPLLAIGAQGNGDLQDVREWYGTGGFTWKIMPEAVTLNGTVNYAFAENAVVLQPYDTVTSSFPYTQESLQTLQPTLSLALRRNIFALRMEWTGNLMDRTPLMPEQKFTLSAEATEKSERWGANFSSEVDLYDSPVMPRLGLGGFVKVTDGVRLVAEASDLLAPIISGGRPTIGDQVTSDFPFIEPGFRFILKTEVSL